MKYLLSIICIFLLVNISIISANGSEKILNVPYSYQGSTQWCYLHGISMVLKYYGYSVEPMDIASKWNLGHDEGSGSIFSQLMNQLNGFMNTYNINATVIPKTIGDASFFLTDFSGYKLYIDGGSPVMVCGQDTTLGIWPNGGHCILIVGYEEGDTNYLYIHDPSGFFTGKWPGAIQTGNEEAFVKVPWSEYKQYFENIINNVLMYIVIFSGATPNPLPGNLWIQDSDIVQGPAALRLNNYPYFKPNRCFDKKSQIYVYFEIFNPTDVDRKYQASIQIRDQSDAVVYQMQPIKTDYCIRKNSLRQHYDIPYLELCNIKDGDYKCYWRLHAINDLNIETDPPLDEIGPIPLSFASQSGSLITSQNSQEHNDNTCVLTAFQSKIIISANVVPIPVIVDIKFKAHYALFESANNIKIRLYIDAYSTENTTTDDTGKTPLSFKIILRNSSGGLIEESNWKSTDTDGDGIFGDPSGYGGSIPFFESQNLNDDIILIFVKWEINQTFGPEQSQDIYCGTIFTNIPIPEGEKPIASITSISPNPAIQEQDSIIFTGSGDDPDTQGTDPKIRTYRWTSDLGKIDGNLELYNGPDASPPQLSASELKVGNHTITLSVQDNEGDWSDGVTAQLIIKSQLPGQADYKVTQFNFTGNTTDLQSGDPLTITLNTTNDGLGSGGSNSFTKVYLTTKQSGDPRSDGVAFSTMPINDLAKGASQGATYGASYPSTSAGTYYLAACADADNQIAESNENNNWLYNSQSLQFKGGPFSASGKIVDQNQNPIPSNNIEIDIDKLDANGTIIVHQVYYTNANGEWQANSCFEAGERYKISPFWSGHSGIFNPPYYYFSSVDRSYADLNFIYCLQAYIFSGIITRESNGQPFTKCVVCSIWAGQTRYLPVDELGKYSSIIVTDDLLTSIFLYPIPEEKIYEWPTFTPINYDISLSGGSRYDLNFQAHFANSCSISGKAVDNNGKAMQGLEIYMRRMPEDPVIAASVKTKNDGTFIFEDVLKGYPYKLYPDTSETIFEPLLFNISNLSNDMSDFIFTGLSKPLADFSANPTTGSLPLNVFFTDKSSSSDAPIKNWL
ncbi:MAG: C39 family peptidase, partial [Candidatus Sumerlaeota bacterium]|nr:C39 family peptidase [Candidatus Sumerlaeota bacterium]